MSREHYVELLKNTMKEHLTNDDRNKFIRMLKGNNIIFTNKKANKNIENNDILDCSYLGEFNILEKSLDNRQAAVKLFEDFEYSKAYKYSAIFNYSGLTDEKIKELIENGTIIIYNENTIDNASHIIDKPTIKESDDRILIKFSLERKFIGANENGVNVKYPIVVALFTDLDILEISLDNLAVTYKQTNDFYLKQIKYVLAWLREYLSLDISNINMRNIIDNIRESKSEEVAVYSQQMSTIGNAKASLKVAEDGNFILPILVELKILIQENEDDFKAASKVYKLLTDFIEEIEATCDLPRIALCWKEKSKDFIVEFIHEYNGDTFSILQHYGRSQDMEAMDYVTRYLISNRDLGEE